MQFCRRWYCSHSWSDFVSKCCCFFLSKILWKFSRKDETEKQRDRSAQKGKEGKKERDKNRRRLTLDIDQGNCTSWPLPKSWIRKIKLQNITSILFLSSTLLRPSQTLLRASVCVSHFSKKKKIGIPKKCEVKWSEVKWSEVKWSELNWIEVKWSEVKWSEVKWSELKWSKVKWIESNWIELKWSELS